MMSRREGTDMILLAVEDCTGRKLMRMKSPVSDEKSIEVMFNSIIIKYGLQLKVVQQPRLEEPVEVEEFKW